MRRPADAVDVHLAGGRAVRLETLWDDDWDGGTYYLVEGTRWFELTCGSMNPPEDRWLPIAETFEFLAEEE
jgi:hypothetical protein